METPETTTLELKAQIEAIIFASPQPVCAKEIAQVIADETTSNEDIAQAIQEIAAEYNEPTRGFYLETINDDQYQFRTVPQAEELMKRLFTSRPKSLSRAAQETLAIIAYRQPVTRVDIEFIRGVDAGSIIKNLLERNLITCIGRKDELGRPMIFGTTDEFLRVFKLKNLKDLAPLESFQPSRDVMENALDKISGNQQENLVKEIQDSLSGETASAKT